MNFSVEALKSWTAEERESVAIPAAAALLVGALPVGALPVRALPVPGAGVIIRAGSAAELAIDTLRKIITNSQQKNGELMERLRVLDEEALNNESAARDTDAPVVVAEHVRLQTAAQLKAYEEFAGASRQELREDLVKMFLEQEARSRLEYGQREEQQRALLQQGHEELGQLRERDGAQQNSIRTLQQAKADQAAELMAAAALKEQNDEAHAKALRKKEAARAKAADELQKSKAEVGRLSEAYQGISEKLQTFNDALIERTEQLEACEKGSREKSAEINQYKTTLQTLKRVDPSTTVTNWSPGTGMATTFGQGGGRPVGQTGVADPWAVQEVPRSGAGAKQPGGKQPGGKRGVHRGRH